MHGVMLAGEEKQGFGGTSQSPPYPQGRQEMIWLLGFS